MNNKPKLFGFYLPLFFVFMAAAVVTRAIAAVKYVDEYGYYSNKLLFYISAVIIVLGVLVFIGYIFFERKDIKLIPSFDSPASYAPSAAVAVALILLGVNLFKITPNINSANSLMKPLTVICAILAILSALYFIVSTFIIRRRSMKRADLGIVTLVFICCYVAYLYFDISLPINSPNKIVDQMAYLGAALFFLYETRLSLGREKWRSYIAFGFIAALLLAYSSIPSLIVYFVTGNIISNSIYESVLSFALFLFATAKILLTTILVEDVESPVVTKIIAASKARSEAISHNSDDLMQNDEPEPEQNDKNQLSITDINYSDSDRDENSDKISEDTADAIESMSLTEDTAIPETFSETSDDAHTEFSENEEQNKEEEDSDSQ